MAGLAALAGAFIAAKRNEQFRRQQLAQQQAQQQQQQASQRQLVLAQIAHMRDQDAIARRENGMDLPPDFGSAPQPTPGIAPGPGGPPKLAAPSTTAPVISASLQKPAAPAGGAPAAQQQPAQPTQSFEGMMAAAAASLQQADALDAQAKRYSDAGAHIPAQRLQQQATALRSQAASFRSMASSIQQQQVTAGEMADRDTARAQKKRIDDFELGLRYPANWSRMSPEQQAAYLNQRVNAAQRVGDKNLVTETQGQIGRIETEADRSRTAAATAAYRAQELGLSRDRVEIERGRLGLEAYRVQHPRSGLGDVTTPAEDVVYAAATRPGLTQQQSLAIVDNPRNGLNFKQRSLLRQAIKDQKPDKPPTAGAQGFTTEARAAQNSPDFMKLPIHVQSVVSGAIATQGTDATVGDLTTIAKGTRTVKGLSPDDARKALRTLGSPVP